MKLKAIVLALFSFACLSAFAQSRNMGGTTTSAADTTPAYLKYPTLPAFKIRMMDSTTIFNTFNIKEGKTTMLILFGADCDHCKHFADSLTRHMDEFKNVQIYMFTFSPFGELKKFVEEYKLSQYKNLIMGQESEFFFASYYKVNSVPDIAIYDKKKKFVKLFSGGAKIDDLLESIK